MEEKIRFVHLAKSGRFTMTELCHDFAISRKTGRTSIATSCMGQTNDVKGKQMTSANK
jgi:hypothetical protein